MVYPDSDIVIAYWSGLADDGGLGRGAVLVRLIVAGATYWILSRSLDVSSEAQTTQASKAALRARSCSS
ncbi:MAG: hypothetical protein ABSF94_11440 [Steroidobacteraceae bacterium]|jgi:hypothetical protein